jgi:ABC-type antimicrobial peptide transport system permease subunit
MARMEGEASLVVLAQRTPPPGTVSGWAFKDTDFLLSDLREMIRMKQLGGSVAYLILMFLAMLAIFDTQVLSIFHRRKEIGTLMALGLTRGSVIRTFTMEGAFNAVLAAIVGAIYGIPLLGYLATSGVPLPASMDAAGFALGEKMYPAYSAVLVVGTTSLVLVITTIVSYLPTRQISRLKPTDALRGKLA